MTNGDITKKELLELIKEELDLFKILGIDEEKSFFSGIIKEIKKDSERIVNEDLSEEEINELYAKHQDIREKLNLVPRENNNDNNQDDADKKEDDVNSDDKGKKADDVNHGDDKKDKKPKRRKVKKVVKEKDQNPELVAQRKAKRKKLIKRISYGAGLIAVIVAMVLLIKSCQKDEEFNKDTFVSNPDTTASSTETTSKVESLVEEEEIDELKVTMENLNSYENMMDYAKEIKDTLPKDIDITCEEILCALKLGNFDLLNGQDAFTSREEVCHATLSLGKVLNNTDTDSIILKDNESDIYVDNVTMKEVLMNMTDNNLSLNDFESCKVNDKYDIYSLCKLCCAKMNEKNDKALFYAKVFNDITARYLIDFSICPNSPISTYYAIAGLFNDVKKTNINLTSGKGFSAIYGSGTKIDGTPGYICIEEEANFLEISNNTGENLGNENCYLYSFLIDENLLDVDKTK